METLKQIMARKMGAKDGCKRWVRKKLRAKYPDSLPIPAVDLD